MSRWAGGTTTQLLILPPGASYAARDFDARVSAATVEAGESDFTSLPGVARQIMILEGEVALEHPGRRAAFSLPPMSPYAFDGGWATRSRGRCRDFNLMTRGGTRGEIRGMALGDGARADIAVPPGGAVAVYLHAGAARCAGAPLAPGDTLVATHAAPGEALELEALAGGAQVAVAVVHAGLE